MSDRWTRSLKGGRLLLGGFLALLVLLFVVRWAIIFYVDLLWFSTLELTGVHLRRTTWEWGVRLLAAAVAAGCTWLTLRGVAGSLQGFRVQRRFGDLVIQERLPRQYVRWAMLGLAAFAAFWFAAALPQGTGLRVLLLLHSQPFGQPDPILGRDLGFYVFLLPVLQGVLTYGFVLLLFVTTMSVAGYAATGALGFERGRVTIGGGARLHLGILAGVFLLLIGLRFYLGSYELLIEGNSGVQGIFGYADERARVPAFRMLAFVSLVSSAAVFWGVRQGRLLPVGVAAGVLAVGGLGVAEVYPAIVQRFEVQPNELERERPYILHAIEFTRSGFALAGIERERFEVRPPDPDTWGPAMERLARLPVWTHETVLPTFRQLEARFEYYDFQQVAFDRYPANGSQAPVVVSVREVDPLGIPAPVSWQNLHLRERYISGMGAVAGLLNGVTDEGRIPMFLTAIPPEYRGGPGLPDVELERPAVYMGSRPQPWAVISQSEEGFRAPDGSPGVPGVDYPDGVRLGSLFRTLALAWRFQDANLLLASEVDRESRLIFRRNVTERVRAIAPFLHLPEAPYPVVHDGRIVWILEGFTLSRTFPLSRTHEIPGTRGANYLRNSVKATVDAVTGEVGLYVADPADPVLSAWRSAFPALFRDLEQMPTGLREHLRYSRAQLDVQIEVLTRFHQEDPAVFHGQQDRWALATELSTGTQPIPYRPEYGHIVLPGEAEESWVLTTLFVPQGRQNLAAFLAARWTPDHGSELLLWDVPAESQFRGPRQVEAMIEQDPEISQQFSLWRQGGSQVWTGHLRLVPVGSSLLYMEPVFLAADADAIPEIRRFLVSDGERVVMHPTLQGAVAGLSAGLTGVAPDAWDGIGAAPDEAPGPEGTPGAGGAREARTLLERAEERLRAGDWEGFGRGLEELRRFLEGWEGNPSEISPGGG